VLKAHGESVPISDHELAVELEVMEEHDVSWVKVPASEFPTDENGIPTEAASEDGAGFEDPETGEIIALDRKQVEAMRALATLHPFKQYREDIFEHLAELKRMALEEYPEMEGVKNKKLARKAAEYLAGEVAEKTLKDGYLLGLAESVKVYAYGPQGIIDYCSGKDTKAGRLYKKWSDEKVKQLCAEELEQMIEEGIFELVVAPDGKEYLKKGPNFEASRRGEEEPEKAEK
jgi:hypothetical protein